MREWLTSPTNRGVWAGALALALGSTFLCVGCSANRIEPTPIPSIAKPAADPLACLRDSTKTTSPSYIVGIQFEHKTGRTDVELTTLIAPKLHCKLAEFGRFYVVAQSSTWTSDLAAARKRFAKSDVFVLKVALGNIVVESGRSHLVVKLAIFDGDHNLHGALTKKLSVVSNPTRDEDERELLGAGVGSLVDEFAALKR